MTEYEYFVKPEEEFKQKCEELAMYQGDRHDRETLDKDWTEEELVEDLRDEVLKLYMGTGLVQKYEHKALYNRDLLKSEYMAESILNEFDVIEEYNREYDRHRGDNKFGIIWFDEWVGKTVKSKLNSNVVRS